MKIKITSDSTCDLSPELLRENDIELFPLFINKGDESFRDGVDIQPADIFAHVAAGGALCSTAAVPVGVFHDRFAELAKEYERLKLSLWRPFEHDRDGYTAAKGEFVRRITEQAKRYFQGEF